MENYDSFVVESQEIRLLENRCKSISPQLNNSRFYKPTILRTPSLIFVFFLTIGLISVLEVAIKVLPVNSKSHHLGLSQLDILPKREVTIITNGPSDTSTETGEGQSTTEGGTFLSATSTAAFCTITPCSVEQAPPDQFVALTSTSTDLNTGKGTNPTNTINNPTSGITATRTNTEASINTGTTLNADPNSGINTATKTGGTIDSQSPTLMVSKASFTTPLAQSALADGAADEVPTNSVQATSLLSLLIVVSTSVDDVDLSAATSGTGFSAQATTSAAPNTDNVKTVTFTWPVWKLFVGSYMPVLLAVVFKSFWSAIHSQANLVVPFMRLARSEGVSSHKVMFSNYLSGGTNPFSLLLAGNWLILCTAVVYLLASLLAPLSSEAVFLDTNYNCPNPDYSAKNPCWPPRLSVDAGIVRVMQSLLSLTAIMALIVLIMIERSSTGICSDPSSIASVASLLHHPDIISDFEKVDANVGSSAVEKQIPERTYFLKSYQTIDGTWRYGIVPGSLDKRETYTNKSDEQQPRRKLWRILVDITFFMILLGFLGLIAAYYHDTTRDSFNAFFNSNTFGPNFIVTSISSVISFQMKRLQRDVNNVAPYRQLSQTASAAQSTIMLSKGSLPLTSILPMLLNNHYFPAVFATVAVLADILVIMSAGIPYSPGRVYEEFLVCTFMSMAILVVMAMSILCLIVWRKSLYMPRRPHTLAGVISYLCASRMLDDFKGCEFLDSKELKNKICMLSDKYVYGEYIGTNEIVRWTVDKTEHHAVK